MITLEEAEAVIGAPAEQWKDRCHEISMKLAPHVGGKVRRGYFHGLTTKQVGQHSWIELSDGTILDPTCHAFTDRPPLWRGPADEYDIGGCRGAPAGPPPDFYETELPEVELQIGSLEYVADLLGQPNELCGEEEQGGGGWLIVSVEQLYWLANLPIQDRETQGVLARWFAAEVYESIIEAGHSAAIPIDRRKWILDEEY